MEMSKETQMKKVTQKQKEKIQTVRKKMLIQSRRSTTTMIRTPRTGRMINLLQMTSMKMMNSKVEPCKGIYYQKMVNHRQE